MSGPGPMLAAASPGSMAQAAPVLLQAAEVWAQLRSHGFARVPGRMTGQAFRDLASALGTPLLWSAVYIAPERPQYLHSPRAMPFHTDHPAAKVIGWWCVKSSAAEPTLLLDMGDLVEALGQRVARTLSTLSVANPSLKGSRMERTPLLRFNRSRALVYYAPWFVPSSLTRAQASALAALEELIRGRSAAAIPVGLQEGEAVFIANDRMLHGRSAVSPRSGRQLLRVWIGT